MHVTIRRIVAGFVIALMIEGAAFAIYFDDLLYLRQSPDVIAQQPSQTFARHAADALRRRKLTARHLETVAAAARGFGLHEIELQALARRVDDEPGDTALLLRTADALRRAGRLDEAERLYLDLLRGTEGASR